MTHYKYLNKKNNSREWLSTLPFLALFPGYFIYHWLVISEHIPLFLGGYINEISAIIIFGFIFLWLKRTLTEFKFQLYISSISITFAIFMIWFGGVILINAVLVSAPSVTKNHLASFNQMLACFIAIRYFPLKFYPKTLLTIFTLCSALVLWAAYNDILSLLLASSDISSISTYQGLARSLLVTSVFTVLGLKSGITRCLIYITCISTLFFLGSRSEVVGAIILFSLYEIFISHRLMLWASLIVVILALFTSLVLSQLDTLNQLLSENRILALLNLGSDDGSLLERNIFNKFAWETISYNPVLGDYGHYERAISSGAYAHNWLSSWVDLGLIGLLLYVLLHFSALYSVINTYRLSIMKNDIILRNNAALAIGLLSMVTVFNLFAKSFTDTGLPLVAGLIASLVIASAKYRRKITGPEK